MRERTERFFPKFTGFRFALLSVFILFSLVGAACAAQKYHIGIVTSTVSQSEDSARGAEFIMAKYKSTSDGGIVKYITYPDNFSAEMETTISQIASMADDPKMKVVVVCEAIPGTTEAFRRIKEKRPDIICLAGEAQEDPSMISAVADLSLSQDFVTMGYIMIQAAKKLGAKTYVHASFPRHMSYELLARRRAIMESTCKELGIKFVFESTPDPNSDVGVAGAQQYLLEKVPAWVKQYGKKTAFFTTANAQVEPMLRQIAAHGGMYVQADSPLQGFPGAFGLDLSKERGNFPAILKKIESTVVEKGARGRLATWPYPSGFGITAALGEFAKRLADGKAKPKDMDQLIDSMNTVTPGVKWKAAAYTDVGTGAKLKSFILAYQDTYLLGKGPLHMNKVSVPAKIYKIK